MTVLLSGGRYQFDDARFRNNHAFPPHLPARLEGWRIAVQKAVKALHKFVDGLVFTAQCAKRYLSQVSGNEIRRNCEPKRVFEKPFGIKAAAGQFTEKHGSGVGYGCRRTFVAKFFEKLSDSGHEPSL